MEWANDPYVENTLEPGNYFEKKMEGKHKFLAKALNKVMRPMKDKNLSIPYSPPDDRVIEKIKLEIIYEDPELSKYFEEFMEIKKRSL